MGQPREFLLWRPGWRDAVRGFFLSEHFQGAMQLAMGILFVSLFVLVSALRFPGSCVAVLLYIVVAVTAAPDNHVGTRIFISGFMLGPMWLAIIIGAAVTTIAKLMPSPEAHMVVLCVLGPLAIVPFAVARVGTGHLYLWAMGLVSALYVGMPIIVGFPLRGVAELWLMVLFIIIAALVAMFAGSVLSMLVLPTLASHALEDEVALALRQLGHHLSATTSFLFRTQVSCPAALLPGHLQGMHPLLVHDADPTALAPGLLETETLGQRAAHDVYVALMDWFERQSRPPAALPKSAPSSACGRSTAGGSEAGSTTAKGTFYGADAAGLAAAVAAAAADSFVGWGGAEQDGYDAGSNKSNIPETAGRTAAVVPASSRGEPQQQSIQSDGSSVRQSAGSEAVSGAGQERGSGKPRAAGYSGTGLAGSRSGRPLLAPVPHIADTRQLLAHATMLLNSAAAEPRWLRASQRAFESKQWAAVIAQAQLLATRLSALDLVERDHCALLQEMHMFSIAADMQQLLRAVYASAAAVLAVLSAQAGDRRSREQGCCAATPVLQGPEWRQGRQQLLVMQEAALVRYCAALHAASADTPFVMPKAQWVRQLMFFILATSSVMDAVDSLAAAATSALTAAPSSSRKQALAGWTHKQQQQQKDAQQLPQAMHGAAAGPAADIEAGVGAAGTTAVSKQPHPLQQQQQQHENGSRLEGGSAAAAAPAAAGLADQQHAAAAAEASCTGKLLTCLSSSFARHTAWVSPWLPLAQNRVLFAHLKAAATKELPAMLSSREAFLRQIKGRRFVAGLKYWIVLSCVLVGTLLLLYFVPPSYRYAPNFGYSAAAVGMSDRVESTVHKVISWTASAVVGATLGWSLMAQPAMANNPVALAAVICCFCFLVGSLGRSKNMLVVLYTLMTVASVVMCQYTPACCDDTGSTMVAVVRGASVAAASLFAVAVQNLVWPWYTSSWALEQLGCACQEAAELLAGMVCELYADTHALIEQQQQQQQQMAAAAAEGRDGGDEGGGGGQQVPRRLAMLDAGARRAQRHLVQQQQHEGSAEPSDELATAAGVLADPEAATEGASAPAAAALPHAGKGVLCDASGVSSGSLAASSCVTSPAGLQQQQQQQQQGLQGHSSASRPPYISSDSTPDFSSSRAAALTLHDYATTKQVTCSLQERLKERRQQRLRAAGPAAAPAGSAAAPAASSPLVLQGRLLRPLVQVKISLLLDTTAWSSGLYATPPVVLRMLAAMFDVADALGALQQASSIKVAAVSGSWDWTLLQMSRAWGDVMLAVLGLADGVLAHVTQLGDATAAALLTKIQEVQHLRYEFFARSRDLRRLLHVAVASDDTLLVAGMPGSQPVHLQGHMRYSAAVYTAGKVLDRMTMVARCALEAGQRA